jgi:hypothetical protein
MARISAFQARDAAVRPIRLLDISVAVPKSVPKYRLKELRLTSRNGFEQPLVGI